MEKIGITERGDPSLDLDWIGWVGEGKPAILITKNPEGLYQYLDQCFQTDKINIIVHCTITGYGGTILEPNVPLPVVSLEAYGKLIDLLGKDRVVLRVDPIIVTNKGLNTAADMIIKAADISPQPRIRISFLDMYPHVKQRFENAGLPVPQDSFHASLNRRVHAWKHLGCPEICGEPGFQTTPCISEIDCELLGVKPVLPMFSQRKTCGCLANKHELLNGKKRCKHFCLYCYWKD